MRRLILLLSLVTFSLSVIQVPSPVFAGISTNRSWINPCVLPGLKRIFSLKKITPPVPGSVCGDHNLDACQEECDDGNLVNNDGCSSVCKKEFCGDGILQSIEECDDKNNAANDGCYTCHIEKCGDGIQQANEQCDDGDLLANDGCDATCHFVPIVQNQPANIPLGTILFVTQVPWRGFSTILSVFGNQGARVDQAPRGGDLMLRYPDGSLRNLTQEAGYGNSGLQGSNAIAVRQPTVHWSGAKALFSMAVGSPNQFNSQANYGYRWQIYEVSGLGQGESAVISKISNQPLNYNNIAPFYGTNGRIFFTSDMIPGGAAMAHLYPRLDEYEKAPTVTGIWSMDPNVAGGDYRIAYNAPSGAFDPEMISDGRIIWTNWDHGQRDQQADSNQVISAFSPSDFNDETVGSGYANINSLLDPNKEVFPEKRSPDLVQHTSAHFFNQFFPWQINEDGSDPETINHVGRHEFGGTYNGPNFTDDPNLKSIAEALLLNFHANHNFLQGDGGILQMNEDPVNPLTIYATYSSEFAHFSGGDLLRIDIDPLLNPEDMQIELLTNTQLFAHNNQTFQDGHYRDPLPLSNGSLVASYTDEIANESDPKFSIAAQGPAGQAGAGALYDYRLYKLKASGNFMTADVPLTSGITKQLSWYSPDVLLSYNGPLWELSPVEVLARPIPPQRVAYRPSQTQDVLNEEGIDEMQLRNWMIQNNLALLTSYNVTQRDRADIMQPMNLKVPGGMVQSIASPGKVYDVTHFQMVQADALRSYRPYSPIVPNPNPPSGGRRLIGQFLHENTVTSWLDQTPGSPVGSVKIAIEDGSVASFVPARKPMMWQLTDSTGKAIVRERVWVSFQPGEIRTCTACHGINSTSQTGSLPPANKPEALRKLLQSWKAQYQMP